MRSQFKVGELPAELPSPSAGSDLSSFAQIFRGLALIDGKCAQDGNPGWYPAGMALHDVWLFPEILLIWE